MSHPPHSHPRERGIALLLVMWIFMVLGVLALDFARYIRDDAMATVNLADETRGYYLAVAGVNKALFDLFIAKQQNPGGANDPTAGTHAGLDDDDKPPTVPPDGQWHEDEFAGGRYAVRMNDEAARLSLNALAARNDGAALTRIVQNLLQLRDKAGSSGPSLSHGIGRRQAADVQSVVDSIQDWRDADDFKRPQGAESEYYLGLRNPYRAKNGRFDAPEELLLVKGITTDLFYGGDGVPGLRDIFSVYTSQSSLNARTVTGDVLEALLAADPSDVTDLVSQRDEDPVAFANTLQARLLALDAGLAGSITVHDREPVVVTIEARADLKEDRNQSRIAVVADISSDEAEGAKIIRWIDRAPWEGGLPSGEPGDEDKS